MSRCGIFLFGLMVIYFFGGSGKKTLVFFAYSWNKTLFLYFFSNNGTPETKSRRSVMKIGPMMPSKLKKDKLAIETIHTAHHMTDSPK